MGNIWGAEGGRPSGAHAGADLKKWDVTTVPLGGLSENIGHVNVAKSTNDIEDPDVHSIPPLARKWLKTSTS